MYTLEGKIVYDPKIDGSEKPWFVTCRLTTHDDLFNLHKYWINKMLKMKVQPSLWGPHITIVRGEEPFNKSRWKEYDGLTTQFEVVYPLKDNGFYFWYEVRSELFSKIREDLGLRPPRSPFHLTIARFAEGKLNTSIPRA